MFFRPMWELFFNLFDNALKHSGLDVVQIHVETDIKEDSTFVRVSNPLSGEIDINELRSKTKQLNSLSLDRKSDLSKLRLEGGSGVAKLHKIVRHEIGDNLGDYTIHFDVNEEEHFVASVQFNIGVEE